MAFTKRNVKDRIVQFPRRYQLVEVQSGIFDLIPVPGTITEAGTAINKAYLQPIEDAIGDIENGITVVPKAYSANNATIAERATKLDTARKINGVNFDGQSDITVVDNTKSPTNHASPNNTYGLGIETHYGHVALQNSLNQVSFQPGLALSGYMGYVLDQKIKYNLPILLAEFSLGYDLGVDITSYIRAGYDEIIFRVDADVYQSNSSTSTMQFMIGVDNNANIGTTVQIPFLRTSVAKNSPFTASIHQAFMFKKGQLQYSYDSSSSYVYISTIDTSSIAVNNNNTWHMRVCRQNGYITASGNIVIKIYGRNYAW